MNGHDDVDIQVRMTRAQAREFAEGLTDDEFRGRLEQNPREVLAQYGIELPSQLIPENVSLPQGSEVEQILETIPGGYPLRGEADAWFFYPILHLVFALAFLEEEEPYSA